MDPYTLRKCLGCGDMFLPMGDGDPDSQVCSDGCRIGETCDIHEAEGAE